ncbi:MAG: flagellar filament capping protein FliD [Lachnospiraceae bacterium]
MGIGLSGMVSGMDTDSIVKALVSAQRTKATKIENKITLNKWTTDAWSSLNTKIYSFYTKYASKLRMQSSYMTRKASSSNESVAKATAGSSAAVGTHTLQVKKLASSQYVTGAKVGSADTYNKNTKLTEFGSGVAEGTLLTITGKKGTDSEKVVKLEVTADTTVNDFLNACKSAGLTASFDTTQQRFFISSSQSGKDDAFSITTSALSEDAANVFTGIENGINTSLLTESEKTNYEAAMATLRQNVDVIGDVLADTFDYETADKTQKAVYDAVELIKNISVNQYAGETAEKKVTDEDLLTISNGAASGSFELYGTTYDYNELHTKAEDSITTGYKFRAAGEAMLALKESGIVLGEAYADPEKLTYAHVESAEETKAQLVADGKLDGIDVTNIDELNAAVEAGTLTESDVEALKVLNTWNYTGTDANGDPVDVQAVYTASYDASVNSPDHETAVQAAMYETVLEDHAAERDAKVAEEKALLLADDSNTEINELKALIETNLSYAAAAGSTASASGLSALGLGEITGSAVSESAGNGMVVVEAANSLVVLDGATMEESSNNFTVNGITLDLVSTTLNKSTGDYDSIQITVGKDTESTYNLVKEAITEYNKLIEEMNGLYYAKSARGYDPLTDEQKEAMSESDIENWEGKIKGALLRRDESLGGLLSGMRTALSSTYTNEDGKEFSLSSFGIVTGNYTEYGKLHIYGDEEDSTYGIYQDRLKAALEEDPDEVMNALSSIFGNLYSTMTEKCAKTEISSALTFYNDKQYNTLLEGYEKDLDKMEDKIADLEDRYYKQFTAMETALSKLQSQTNSLASMLGTSSGQ